MYKDADFRGIFFIFLSGPIIYSNTHPQSVLGGGGGEGEEIAEGLLRLGKNFYLAQRDERRGGMGGVGRGGGRQGPGSSRAQGRGEWRRGEHERGRRKRGEGNITRRVPLMGNFSGYYGQRRSPAAGVVNCNSSWTSSWSNPQNWRRFANITWEDPETRLCVANVLLMCC
jgi:hypothetical protein